MALIIHIFVLMRSIISIIVAVLSLLFCLSCSRGVNSDHNATSDINSKYFKVEKHSGSTVIFSVSPFDSSVDSLVLYKPVSRMVCMSSSYVAYLSSIGCDSTIVAVSGKKYISDPAISNVPDIGYDTSIDYEKILALKPDVVLAYTVSSVVPKYITTLRSLGVKVFILYEQLEDHPLARAEYVKLFGTLTGRESKSDSVYAKVSESYLSLAGKVKAARLETKKVLINIPYSDQWYIPGGDNYMSLLVHDAGGEILGSVDGARESSIISLEKAYSLSKKADYWINVGWCRGLDQLKSVQPLFSDFPIDSGHIYNNTRRVTSGGGNDFWESGAVRADLILSDLVKIFHPEVSNSDSLYYYFKLQ